MERSPSSQIGALRSSPERSALRSSEGEDAVGGAADGVEGEGGELDV
jgi:hypothetical protein